MFIIIIENSIETFSINFQVLTRYDCFTEDYASSREIKSDLNFLLNDSKYKEIIESLKPLKFKSKKEAKEAVGVIKAYDIVDEIEYNNQCKKWGWGLYLCFQ